MSPLLDLSQADESGFPAVPGGTYEAEVKEVTWKETKGRPNSKLPKGTPMMNVQFILHGNDSDGASVENRRVFSSLIIAPEYLNEEDKKKKARYEHKDTMDGILVRFLESIGYDKEEIKGGSFNPDLDDMKGRKLRVVVGRREYKDPETEEVTIQNEVKGFKKPGDGAESGLL